MRRFLIIGAAAFALAAGSPATAGLRDHSMELGAYVTAADFDNDSNVDNSAGLGFSFGYLFMKEHELEFAIEYIGTQASFDNSLDVGLTSFKVGYVYNILPKARVSPFLTAGAGFQELTLYQDNGCCNTQYDSDTDPLSYAGGGVRFFINPVLNIRFDAQAVGVFPNGHTDEALWDGVFNLGVGWIFGGR